jgi:serine/threonine protein kinase
MRFVSYEVMRVQDRTPERLGPYRLVRRIGEGGMGVVYLATDAAGGRVAVKALHPGLAQEGTGRRRMGREVETMQRVRSPHVAEVLDADLDSDPPYIVTRYVPGLALDAVVDAGGPMTGPALARLAHGLAEALSAVHAAGVVHRDLKPGNVMISDGEPVVIDFGIAQLGDTTRLTLTGMFMGTPGYLAPEVIEGKDSGTASDVHSWGATVAFAATGRPPYGTGPYEGIFYRIMHGAPDLDTLPEPLREVILAALSRDPASRPAAADLQQQIGSLDPAMLIPSPPAAAARLNGAAGPHGTAAAAGPAILLGELAQTVSDGPAWPASPGPTVDGLFTTRPLTTSSPSDVQDLLPPVSYQPAGSAAPGGLADGPYPAGAAGHWDGAAVDAGVGVGYHGAGPAAGAAPADVEGEGSGRTVGPISAWSPLVIATVAMVVAVSVMAPIIGTAIALAVLVALRAVSTTRRQLARRQTGDGHASSVPLLAVALYPVALLRAVFGLALVAPIGLLAFCVTAAAAIIAIPVHPLPQAVALGAGALVAVIGLGPGSGGSRAALASLYSSAARSQALLAVAYVGVLAVAIWAGVSAWYQSPAPAYWPIRDVHVQLLHFPAIRTMLTDVRQNLLRLARHIGL